MWNATQPAHFNPTSTANHDASSPRLISGEPSRKEVDGGLTVKVAIVAVVAAATDSGQCDALPDLALCSTPFKANRVARTDGRTANVNTSTCSPNATAIHCSAGSRTSLAALKLVPLLLVSSGRDSFVCQSSNNYMLIQQSHQMTTKLTR